MRFEVREVSSTDDLKLCYRARRIGSNRSIVIRTQGDPSTAQAASWKGRQPDRHVHLEFWLYEQQGPIQDQPTSTGSFGESGRLDIPTAGF